MATHSSILPGKSQGQRSLMGYSPWGHKGVGHDRVTKQQQQLLCQSLAKCPTIFSPFFTPSTISVPKTVQHDCTLHGSRGRHSAL